MKLLNLFKKQVHYPAVVDPGEVGTYPAFTKSGAGYFYDDVLEYRVWVHPERGGEDKNNGKDYFYSFKTHQEAQDFSNKAKGTEEVLALILQKEYINEPTPGVFEHIKKERLTEWVVTFLPGRKRKPDSIEKFLAQHISK